MLWVLVCDMYPELRNRVQVECDMYTKWRNRVHVMMVGVCVSVLSDTHVSRAWGGAISILFAKNGFSLSVLLRL